MRDVKGCYSALYDIINLQALANRLYDIMNEEKSRRQMAPSGAEERKKDTGAEEDEEDYLDESKPPACAKILNHFATASRALTLTLHCQRRARV